MCLQQVDLVIGEVLCRNQQARSRVARSRFLGSLNYYTQQLTVKYRGIFILIDQKLRRMQEKDSKPKEEFEINRTHTFQPCFEEHASFISRMFFLWSHELIRRGNEKHLEMEDLSDLKENEEPAYSESRFSEVFYRRASETKSRLFNSFKEYLGPNFIIAGILATISNLLQFSGPVMINQILEFLKQENPVLGKGLMYVSILVVCYLLRTIIYQHSMHFVNLSCIQVLNSANSLIYNKIMRLSSASRKYLEVGTIMNNINVDVMSFYYFIMMSTFLFSAPLMILTAIVLLVLEMGWIGLTAPLLFFFGMAAQQKLMTKGFQMRKDQLFWSDKRSKCVNEYFSGIRIIKYYGWEQLVAEKIENIRTEELKLNYKVLMIRTYVEVIMNMLPIFSSIIIFAVYVALEGEEKLTTAKVFTVLSIYNLIATPMRLIVITLINFMNGRASLERVSHFLGYEERKLKGINLDDQELKPGQIAIIGSKFNWESEDVKKHFESGKELFNKNKKDGKKEQEKPKPQPKKSKGKKEKKNKKKKVGGDGKKKKKQKKSIMTEEGSLTEKLLSSEAQTLESQKNKYALVINDLKINSGDFVSVIGRVGSGKSTLLSAILGEIDKVEGQVNRRGSIAYIPQTSWLRSATIRENVLFETEYNEKRYKQILKICELEQDLEILGGGDMTEIGEKGVNLSGGQKQRISIARALYSDADIFLIDDCLSALDAYVGKSIFFNVLKDYLHSKGKTIIFVTNAIDYTEYSDRILVLDNGRIIQDGSPKSLENEEDSLYGQLKMQYKKSKTKEQEDKEKEEEEAAKKKKKSEDEIQLLEGEKKQEKEEKKIQGLVKVEQRLKGSVPMKFYYRFFTGPGGLPAFFMFFFILLAQCSRVGSDWWLGEWSTNGFHLPEGSYIWVYAGISFVVGGLMYVKGVFFAKFITGTSRVIQRKLIKVLLHTPLSWFDVTPTGRILARTTKDQDDLDNSLSFNVQYAAQNIFIVISSILLVSIAAPLYLIVAVISMFIYYKLVGMYLNSSRELKRLEANTRAPLISHFQETISGMYVIRAFQKEKNFINKYFQRQKYYITSLVNQNITTRWINLVTDMITIVTIAAAGYLGVMSAFAHIGSNSTSLIGLSLVWSLQISSVLPFTLRILADTESNMNAVVRLYDYIDNNPREAEFEEPKPKSQSWPKHGVYSAQNISFKYRPELPLVIKKISFDIKENAKIGIVGRTGSGKSTMTLGLLRILELADNDDGSHGHIDLDGENTSELGLHYLRHNITIIPQDPTLFTGTIKTNIDPFNQYDDEKIAFCLKKVELWDKIKDNQDENTEMKRKINSKVDDSGSNFSLGQRQLICMARALIRRPKVLLMDEATASIDQQTDETIQTMIRKEFNETTVITIAHRLNTIIHYDKILVLNNGEVEEYDSPLTLVKNEESFLGKLIRKVSPEFTEKMVALAETGNKKE